MRTNRKLEQRRVASSPRARAVHRHYARIYELVRRKKFDDALNFLRPNGRLAPEFRQEINHSWYVVGDILERKGDFPQALAAFKRALKDWPGDSDAMWSIADCYSEIGSFRMALKYYRMASTERPNEPGLLYNIANTLFDQGKFSEASDIYASIKTNDPLLLKKIRKNQRLALQNGKVRSESRTRLRQASPSGGKQKSQRRTRRKPKTPGPDRSSVTPDVNSKLQWS